MTDSSRRAARPRRRDESMSLFVDITTQALDPAYVLAAAARSGAPRPAGRTSVPALLAVLAATLVIAIAAVQAHLRAPAAARARATLLNDVRTAGTTVARLRHDADALRTRTTALRDRALASDAAGAALVRRLRTEEAVAGTAPVTGPGLLVVLDDGRGAAAANRVEDRDVTSVVNALWAAGAEAVAVGDERLTAQSAIRQAGSALLVNFQPLTPPYEIAAIGDPVGLATRFAASAAADRMRSLAQVYGLRFQYQRADSLSIPGAPQPPLRYAGAPAPTKGPT